MAGLKTVAVIVCAAAVPAGCSASRDSQPPREEKAAARAETTDAPLPWSNLASQALVTNRRRFREQCANLRRHRLPGRKTAPRPVFCPPLVPKRRQGQVLRSNAA